jgi:hypothetical protein
MAVNRQAGDMGQSVECLGLARSRAEGATPARVWGGTGAQGGAFEVARAARRSRVRHRVCGLRAAPRVAARGARVPTTATREKTSASSRCGARPSPPAKAARPRATGARRRDSDDLAPAPPPARCRRVRDTPQRRKPSVVPRARQHAPAPAACAARTAGCATPRRAPPGPGAPPGCSTTPRCDTASAWRSSRPRRRATRCAFPARDHTPPARARVRGATGAAQPSDVRTRTAQRSGRTRRRSARRESATARCVARTHALLRVWLHARVGARRGAHHARCSFLRARARAARPRLAASRRCGGRAHVRRVGAERRAGVVQHRAGRMFVERNGVRLRTRDSQCEAAWALKRARLLQAWRRRRSCWPVCRSARAGERHAARMEGPPQRSRARTPRRDGKECRQAAARRGCTHKAAVRRAVWATTGARSGRV